MKHYVYILINTEDEKFYIGCRSCKCLITEDTYKGSSSVMTEEDKKQSLKIVLKVCSSREEAIEITLVRVK